MRDVVLSTTITAAVRGCNLEDRGEEYLEESAVHRHMEDLEFTGTFEAATAASGNTQAIYLDNMVLHQLMDIDHKGTHHVLGALHQTVI